MNWLNPPEIYYILLAIFLLSIPAYYYRKAILTELKNWRIKGVQFMGVASERNVQAPTPPNEKESAWNELKASSNPITYSQAQAWTKAILGNMHSLFWNEISKNTKNAELLSQLTSDPRFLEGLIVIFERSGFNLPQNFGTLFDYLFNTIWQKEMAGKNKWIPAKDAKRAFARLVRFGYKSEINLFDNYAWAERGRGYAYERLLDVLGRQRDFFVIERLYNASHAYISWCARIWENISKKLDKMPRVLQILFGVPLSLIWSGIVFLGSMPGRLIKLLGFRKRRALILLALAEKFHIIQRNKEGLVFHPHAWWAYFSAVDEVGHDIEGVLYHSGKSWGTNNWQRLRPEHDETIIALCGLVSDPRGFIEKLIPIDPYLAAQCMLSGIDNVPDTLRIQAHNRLMDSVLNIKEGAEIHSLSSAHFLKELKNDPSVVEEILDAVDEYHIEFAGPRLAKLLASYEKHAFNVLVRRVETTRRSKQLALLALGFLRDDRAIPILHSMMTGQDGNIRMTALMVLATCFDDERVIAEWESTLLYRNKYEDGTALWSVADNILGAEVIPLLLSVLEHGLKMPLDGHSGHWGDAGHRFVSMLERGYREERKNKAEEILLNAAKEPNNLPLLQGLILKGLGAIQSKKAVGILINSLSHPVPEVQIEAIHALGQIKDTNAVDALIGQVYSQNLFVAEAAIRALGEVKSPGAVRVLKKQLGRTDAALHPEIQNFSGYPLALLAMHALVEIKTDEALDAAADWCRDHLVDTRKFNWGNRGETVAEECVNYLDYMIQTDKARQYLQEWQMKHVARNE